MGDKLRPNQFRDLAGRVWTVPPWVRSELWAALATLPEEYAADGDDRQRLTYRVVHFLGYLLADQRRAFGIDDVAFVEGFASSETATAAYRALLAATVDPSSN